MSVVGAAAGNEQQILDKIESGPRPPKPHPHHRPKPPSATFEPGGNIDQHPTGFGQLFLVVDVAGWVSGQGAYYPRCELHANGSEVGMTAIMIQVRELEPTATVG